jgi:hypothetical protein
MYRDAGCNYMKLRKYRYLFCFCCELIFFLFISCIFDQSGNLFLISGFEYDVVVHTVYDYNGTAVDRKDEFYPGMSFAVAARQTKYSHVTAIWIETPEGEILAEYTPEYLISLRKIFDKKKNEQESWIFTEKGLFLETKEISRRYNFDREKILAYYRSDEAVQDFQAMLEKDRSAAGAKQ